ncbi:FAD-binding oxidoreductase [Evansella halocellulosilytica]|uniref:FAD-binding oxidoreductase n=1 Tax=Evansella halocellulosilytica TaxID=2011013 RepID=UPI000BB7C00E|nr:FAD-binding oxidoreductase [Evansella halocellulosilytica]
MHLDHQTYKKRRNLALILSAALIYSTIFTYSIYQNLTHDELLIHDVSQLFPAHVKEIVEGEEEESLVAALQQANEEDLKVSIAGTRHSQGGHAFYEDSLWLDMTSYNEILALDEDEKTITVQSGVTWEQIQEAANEHGLSVKVMQSSNIFTVGGSLSSNVHGRDPNYGPIIETVDSFRLLMADGTIQEVNRDENEELFELAIGGFGLFGVILDVTLELTDDELYVSTTEKIDYKDYPDYIENEIKGSEDVGLHYARLSATPNGLFEDMYMTTYHSLKKTDELYPKEENLPEFSTLQEEKNVRRDRFFLGLSRHFDWGKNLVWSLQQRLYAEAEEGEVISRNNAMRPPVEFLEYDSSRNTDILQEYFIPTDDFPQFVEELKTIVEAENINLLNVTVRFTPEHDEGHLNYATEDTLALVLLINHSLSDDGVAHIEQATQQIVDAVLDLGGTHYLTYQKFPTNEQIREAYPNIDSFFEEKQKYDPDERFMNYFYEEYVDEQS